MATAQHRQLSELMEEVDPRMSLCPQVEEFLLEMAEEFIDQVSGFSARIAKHRRSKIVEARDIQFCLEKNWDIRVYPEGKMPLKKKDKKHELPLPSALLPPTPIHRLRLEAKRKAQLATAEKARKKKKSHNS